MKKLFVLVVVSLLCLPVFYQLYYINVINNDFSHDSCGLINVTINPTVNHSTCGVIVNGVLINKSYTYTFNLNADHIFNYDLHIETTCGCIYDFTIRLIFVDGDDCNDYGMFVLGTDELAIVNRVISYPNPSTNQITLNKIGDVLIYSSNGKLVKTIRNEKVIDVSDLPSGLYFGFINGEKFNFIKN